MESSPLLSNTQPISVFQINGAADSVIPIEGGPRFGHLFLDALESAELWSNHFSCTSTPDIETSILYWQIKLYLKKTNKSNKLEKVGEFGKFKKSLENKEPLELVKIIATLHNQRIQSAMQQYNITDLKYHCIVIHDDKFIIHEEVLEPV